MVSLLPVQLPTAAVVGLTGPMTGPWAGGRDAVTVVKNLATVSPTGPNPHITTTLPSEISSWPVEGIAPTRGSDSDSVCGGRGGGEVSCSGLIGSPDSTNCALLIPLQSCAIKVYEKYQQLYLKAMPHPMSFSSLAGQYIPLFYPQLMTRWVLRPWK